MHKVRRFDWTPRLFWGPQSASQEGVEKKKEARTDETIRKSSVSLVARGLILVLSVCGIDNALAQQQAKERSSAKAESKEEYEKRIQARLDELDRQIDHLKVKAASEGTRAQKELNIQLKELDKQQQAATRQIKQLRTASADAWQKARPKLEAAMDELEKAYEKAASHFR